MAAPLKLLDCCPISDGAVALVVSADAAAGPRITIRGAGQAHLHQHLSAMASVLGCGAAEAARRAFDQAGLPLAMPTMAVVLGFPGSWMNDPATGIDFSKIVHGDELLELHRPLPAAGTVVAHHRVVRVVDKGASRGATITYDKELFDKADGTKLATVRHTTFARGDGGFSREAGPTDEAPPAPAPVPAGAPDRVCEIATLPQQALLYRLCADRNPLHSEPSVAIEAGFPRPILHGLCTYGIACRAVLAQWCGHDPRRLKSLFARFSAPVLPGETLRFEMYEEGGGIAFRARVTQRDKVVLDYGRAEIV